MTGVSFAAFNSACDLVLRTGVLLQLMSSGVDGELNEECSTSFRFLLCRFDSFLCAAIRSLHEKDLLPGTCVHHGTMLQS